MLKLATILELRENINQQIKLLQTLSEDYLDLIDDDLYTIDLEAKPSFTDELLYGDLMVTFNAERKLKDKYIQRFTEDFGLSLVSVDELENNYYKYLFEVKK